jgi:hypothetical protein
MLLLPLSFGLDLWRLHTVTIQVERPWEFMAKKFGLWASHYFLYFMSCFQPIPLDSQQSLAIQSHGLSTWTAIVWSGPLYCQGVGLSITWVCGWASGIFIWAMFIFRPPVVAYSRLGYLVSHNPYIHAFVLAIRSINSSRPLAIRLSVAPHAGSWHASFIGSLAFWVPS